MKLLLPCLLLAAGAAHAQATFSIGPTVGANLATIHSSSNREYGYRFGLLVGAQAEVGWGRFAFQPALLFSQLGSNFRYTYQPIDPNDPNYIPYTVDGSQRLNYLAIPLPVAFRLTGTATGPQVFAGPYVGVLLGGHEEIGGASSSVRVTDQAELTTASSTARRLDAGLQAGAGFRIERLLLRASYSLGLRTIVPDYTYHGVPINTYSNYNRGFQASLAYLFSRAK